MCDSFAGCEFLGIYISTTKKMQKRNTSIESHHWVVKYWNFHVPMYKNDIIYSTWPLENHVNKHIYIYITHCKSHYKSHYHPSIIYIYIDNPTLIPLSSHKKNMNSSCQEAISASIAEMKVATGAICLKVSGDAIDIMGIFMWIEWYTIDIHGDMKWYEYDLFWGMEIYVASNGEMKNMGFTQCHKRCQNNHRSYQLSPSGRLSQPEVHVWLKICWLNLPYSTRRSSINPPFLMVASQPHWGQRPAQCPLNSNLGRWRICEMGMLATMVMICSDNDRATTCYIW